MGSLDGSFDSSNEEKRSVPYLDHDLEKELVLHLLLLMVQMKDLGWVLQMSCLIVLMNTNR